MTERLKAIAAVLGGVAGLVAALTGLIAAVDCSGDYRSPGLAPELVNEPDSPRAEAPAQPVERCEWRGTAPLCHGSCLEGEVERRQCIGGSDTDCGRRCWAGHKVLCCKPESQSGSA